MSLLTISTSVRDPQLRMRIQSCALQQAWNNPTIGVTDFAKIIRANPDKSSDIVFAVCTAPTVETAYAFALQSELPNPGENEAIVTDSMILAVVQSKWPMGAM